LAALRDAKAAGQRAASIVNVKESSIARESDQVWPTYAGPEIGVASTKAFTASSRCWHRWRLPRAAHAGTWTKQRKSVLRACSWKRRGTWSRPWAKRKDRRAWPRTSESPGCSLSRARPALSLALEGALKLKEISYIHAEGYAAGEMKHGPIALIDENVPVIVIAPYDALFEKTASNMHEVMARGGRVVLISDRKGISEAGDKTWANIEVPTVDPFIAPLVYALPIQLIAYHTAVAKGTDVDQPRNLAKSVTVE